MTASAEPVAHRALLVAMMDMPAEFEDETNLWFDYDHIPERLSCEGIEFCQRLELSPLHPFQWTPGQQWMKYMHVYTLASIDTLSTPAYQLQKHLNGGSGSMWRQLREVRQKARGVWKDRSLRTMWVERDVPWDTRWPVEVPQQRICLVQFRHDLGDMDGAVNDFIDKELVPELLTVPGFLGCERYEAGTDDLAANSRPPMYHPKYMDVFDVLTPEVLVAGLYRKYMESLVALDPDLKAAWTPAASGIYFERPSPWRAAIA